MNKIFFSLMMLSLIACGSSSSQNTKETNGSTPSATNSSTPSATNSSTPSDSPSAIDDSEKFDTFGWIISDYDGEGTFLPSLISLSDVSKEDMNIITIEGKTIKLLPDNYTRQTNYTVSRHGIVTRAVSGKKYHNFIFGAVNGVQPIVLQQGNTTTADISGAFVHGIKTPSSKMDTLSGIAVYEGDAFVVKEGVNGIQHGDAFVTINFTQKELGGELTGFGNQIDDIPFKAMVAESMFIGDESNNNATAHTSGYFYGNNAEQIGGVIMGMQDDRDYAASFGAIKK